MIPERKKFFKGIVRLLATAIALLFAVIGFAGITVSWLSQNEHVTGAGMEFQANYKDIRVSYDVYLYDIDTFQGSAFDRDGNRITLNNLTMHAHDLIFRERNKYTPVVIRIQLSGQDVPESGTASITLFRDTSAGVTDGNGKISSNSTSVLRFTPALGSFYYADTEGEPDVAAIYENVVNGGENIPSVKDMQTLSVSKTFTVASVAGDGNSYTYQKAESLVFTLDYTAADWNELDGNRMLNIYLLMDYDTVEASETVPSLTEVYCKDHEIHSGQINFDNKIVLNNDFLKIFANAE